jgi:hypothetical protein
MAVTSVTADPTTGSVAIETNYPGINKATIWRYVAGKPSEVRGYILKETGAEVPPTRDYEAPLGVQIGYASLNWTTTKPAPPATPTHYVTINVVDTTGWLKFPAHPERNFAMECITALPERDFASNAETFRVIGRAKPIAIHDVMTWWKGKIEWIVPSLADHERHVAVVSTGTICLLQTMPAYGAINEFVIIAGLSTAHVGPARRASPQRVLTMDFQTIDAPVGTYTVSVTYTYSEALGDWTTYGTPPTPAGASVLYNYDNYFSLYLNDRG